jgi:hypothetical protein
VATPIAPRAAVVYCSAALKAQGKNPKNTAPSSAMVMTSAAGTRAFGQTKGNTGKRQIIAIA